ncbi:hypothetical protein AB0H36_28080 [Kribbella sp. NPDC050820]|uniref:hypothetical protein n=1 Tax=Kribbella sp. NPDC050820 TaxID=3155408 RepID=UPI0033F51F17
MIHVGCCGPVETDAPLAITINPEARVTVARTGVPLGQPTPGEWHTIPVAVVNEGFVTGPLSIEPEPVDGVAWDLLVQELTGERRQDTSLRVRVDTLAVVDVTLTCRAMSALGGLATHSTTSFLLRPLRRLL